MLNRLHSDLIYEQPRKFLDYIAFQQHNKGQNMSENTTTTTGNTASQRYFTIWQ